MAKVTLLVTGETATFNDEYAERLIEQGKAVPVGDVPEGVKPAGEDKPAESKAPEKAEARETKEPAGKKK